MVSTVTFAAAVVIVVVFERSITNAVLEQNSLCEDIRYQIGFHCKDCVGIGAGAESEKKWNSRV